MQIVAYTLKGHNPYIQGEKLKDFAAQLQNTGELDRLNMAVIEKRMDCNDIEYTYTCDTDDDLPIDDFTLMLGQNYSIEFAFEIPNDKGPNKKQKDILVDYGLVLDKYHHDLEITKNIVEGKDIFHAKIKFDMSNFSAAENPWAIRRSNNKHILD